ncbi:MAG: DUF1549 and DUF1553 domain-containing protein [Actinomycetota bacterium]
MRANTADPAHRMPPPSSGKTLTDREKEVLRRWIAQGAPWAQHWAFVAPKRPPLPAVKNKAWGRNPIDQFVLARLEKEGLKPSPEADRTTLLRRLSLDLTGLPPTPQEVDAFLADRRPGAYERQVERLLASPHYGERWGRHWLDAARYADSDGFEKDKPRWVWFYRDWVINALNRDLPYNEFVIQQIAGDLLAREVNGSTSQRVNGDAGKVNGSTGQRVNGATGNGATIPSSSLTSLTHSPIDLQEKVVATGFLRNSMINEEGGIDPEQFRMEAMFDRMDAVGKSVLGLTIQCAQCHTHKFDPITQEDYYRIFAFLNNSHEANVAVYTPADQMKRAELLRRIREQEGKLQHEQPDWRERMAAWEKRLRDEVQPEWRVVRPELDGSGGQKLIPLEDGSILAQGYAPVKESSELTVRLDGKPITAARLELLNDPNLPRMGPGRSRYGLFGLTEFQVFAAPADKPGERVAVKIVSATADANPPERELQPAFDDRSKKRRVTGPIGYATDGKPETAWSIDVGNGRSNVPRKAVFVFEKPVSFPQGTVLTFRLQQLHGGWNNNDNQNNNLGRYRLSVTGAPSPVADPLPVRAREALAIAPAARTPVQAAELFSYWRTTVPEWRAANAEIERLWSEHPEPSTQLVLQEREQPRGTKLLDRGDFLKPTRAVQPGVPSFLHPLPKGAPLNRLTFARWLVDPKSPTASRSIVNRVWQGYFGTGFVASSEDLGSQADPPSHPELLDWLASSFASGGQRDNGAMKQRGNGEMGQRVNGSTKPGTKAVPMNSLSHSSIDPPALGWSLKRLHRLIVTSATYRQSSAAPAERYAADPTNRLLGRGPRVRVEAEIVRDIALAASGLLNPRIGGPSIYPPAPEFLFLPPASYGPKVWPVATGPDRYRRGMYTFRFRSVPYPALEAFDAPNGDASCVRRTRSNTPLQALTTLNEPLFMECAQALALKTLREGGATDAERLTFAFRRCVSRKPTGQELAVLSELLIKQQTSPAPSTLAADVRLPAGVTPGQLRAWTVVSRVLLNLDETITKE